MNSLALWLALESSIVARSASAALASADLLDAEPLARTAAEASRNLAAAYTAAGNLDGAAKAQANAAGFESLAAELAASPRIAADRKMRDALAALPR